MKKQLVYDLPTRFFHWLFAGLFITAFIITKIVDDESAAFSYHMLAGLTLSFLVLIRILWGFFGTQHALFSDFILNPIELLNYFKDILTGAKKRWAGHNPASSWSAVILMTLGLCLGVSGYLMTTGTSKKLLGEVHEIFANAFLIVALTHIAGIILHTIRFKELIGLSMLSGKKDNISDEDSIPSSKPVFGIILVALVVAFGVNLFKNYDSQTQTLKLFGNTLQLGENEEGESGGDSDND